MNKKKYPITYQEKKIIMQKKKKITNKTIEQIILAYLFSNS